MKKLTQEQLKVLAITKDSDLTKNFQGFTREYLRDQKRNLGQITKQIDTDRQMLKIRNTADTTAQKYNQALKHIETLENKIDFLQVIKKGKPANIKVEKTTSDREAVAFMIASDWHIEERVDPKTVNNLNEYNIDIAEQRANKFFVNGVKLVKKEQEHIGIKTICLALLGDFFSGTIHDELKENRTALHNTAILKVQSLLSGGIQYILDNTDCDLIIPCSSGNHSRQTIKTNHSTEYENSYEYLIYKNLEMMFDKNKRVKFAVSTSYHNILKIYDFTVRLHHGHSIKYQGGVGGITIPINKAIAQWNKSIKADFDILG